MPLDHVTHPKSRYRPDIDGLRAVAVLLVIFNHLEVRHFSGGFVGVDVFFVISGYLISSLMLADRAAGTFTFAGFYGRRARRILPAVLLMLLVTSLLAYYVFFPPELKTYSQSELGALFSCANVVFTHQNGYFDQAAHYNPLLHTWSLGVEEQFYVVFPVLFIALLRWGGRHLRSILWLLTAACFALACWWLRLDAVQAFYLAPARAWEFLVGILLAAHGFPPLRQAWQRNLASAVGLVLIVGTGALYTSATPFPGWHALLPCFGTLLVLAAGETGPSTVGSMLSWKPVRAIGLISYSLYLWHWPLQVFQKMANILAPDRYPPRVAKLAILAATFVLAGLSWRFIEQPFRSRRVPRSAAFLTLALVTIPLAWLGCVLLLHDGWPTGFLPRTAAFIDFRTYMPTPEQSQNNTCFVADSDLPRQYSRSQCLAENSADPHVLLYGDSHAAFLSPGLKTAFPEWNVSVIAVSSCSPTLDDPPWTHGLCDHSRSLVFNDYLLHHHVDRVLLVARWSSWDAAHLEHTILWFKQHNIPVTVIGPTTEFNAWLLRLTELARREHDPDLPNRNRDSLTLSLDHSMHALAQNQWHVPYVSMYDNLCTTPPTAGAGPSGCAIYTAQGAPLLWDDNHFTVAGATMFAESMRAHNQLP